MPDLHLPLALTQPQLLRLLSYCDHAAATGITPFALGPALYRAFPKTFATCAQAEAVAHAWFLMKYDLAKRDVEALGG